MLKRLNKVCDKVIYNTVLSIVSNRHYNWIYSFVFTIIVATLWALFWEMTMRATMKFWITNNLFYEFVTIQTLGLTTSLMKWGFWVAIGLSILHISYIFRFKDDQIFIQKERKARSIALENLSNANREFKRKLIKSQRELEKKEKYASSIFNNTELPLVIVNKNLKIVKFNPASENLFKRSQNDMLGRYLTEFTSSVREKEILLRNQAVRNSNPLDTNNKLEINMLTSNSEVRELEITINFMSGYEEFVVSFLDQTSSNRLERELSMQSKIANETISYSGGYLWTKNSEGKYLFCDPSFCADFFGLNSPDGRCFQVIGKTDIELINNFKEDTGLYHSFGDACVFTDNYTIKKGKSCRFIEMGFIESLEENHRVVKNLFILDIVKRPKFNSKGELTSLVAFANNRSDEGANVLLEVKRCLKQGTMRKMENSENIGIYEVDFTSEFGPLVLERGESFVFP